MSNILINRFLIVVLFLSAALNIQAQNEKQITIEGFVFDKIGNFPLQGSMVRLINERGIVVDSMKTRGMMQRGNVIQQRSRFEFDIPKQEGAKYTIEAESDGHDIGYQSVTLSNIGRRESKRTLPTIFLNKTIVLTEVTVTSSKVKFYHKGDTLVYDASAFQVADGSMLDALVTQLPGVELKEGGQIYVNGKYVESLLLNGRDFFGKDNQLMLENLGAYTVKDIAVYDKLGKESKFYGRDTGDKEFVMDVRLKKEYQRSWIANIEAGVGTKERFMGRFFGLHFTPYSQVALFAGYNNVNDQRKPGQATNWTPDNILNGNQTVTQVGIDYNSSFNKSKDMVSGNLTIANVDYEDISNTQRTNFLSAGNTYDYQFRQSKRSNFEIRQNNSFYFNRNYISTSINNRFNYTKYNNSNSSSATTFNIEKQNMNREVIDNIYSTAYIDFSNGILNRTLDNNINEGYKTSFSIGYGNMFKFAKNSDGFVYSVDLKYNEEKSDLFKKYTINYNQATPAYKQNEYYNPTNKAFTIDGHVGYTYVATDFYIQPEYWFTLQTGRKNSTRFMLDRLEDEGVFGTLPTEYLSSLDFDNSYTSKYKDNTHGLSIRIAGNKGPIGFTFTPKVYIYDQSLNYQRGDKNYKVNRTTASFSLASWTEIIYSWAYKNDPFLGKNATQSIKLSYLIKPQTPDLFYLITISDATDPLNIYEGVDKLNNERLHNIELTWTAKPKNGFNNTLMLGYNVTENMLTRGFNYDTATGVRHIRSYNTNGNWQRFVNNSLSMQFGKKKEFTLSSTSRIEQSQMSDMLGIDVAEPVKSTVKNVFLTENLKLNWKIGKQSVGLRADAIWRDTRSDRQGFAPFQATNLNYGLTGVFKLSGNFGLSTDLTCYTRSGYANEALNTTDLVWNARATYSAFKGRWVFMLDGFDILGQLSNVTYGVTAQARTITYTNVMPRYAMLHAQYKLNIHPKQKGKK